jgi:hypothetical protein
MTLDVYASLFEEDLDAVAAGPDALVPRCAPGAGGDAGAVEESAHLRKSGARPAGLEPATSGLEGRCSIR